MRTPTRLTRQNADTWADVLRQEIPQISAEQARSHIASALKEVAEHAKQEEREHCAELVRDAIVTLIDRYLDLTASYSPRQTIEAMVELKERFDGFGDLARRRPPSDGHQA